MRKGVKECSWYTKNERNMIFDNVIAIVFDGYRYPARGGDTEFNTEELRIPEDESTRLAFRIFNVNAYATTSNDQFQTASLV